jgi:hypothetical protein
MIDSNEYDEFVGLGCCCEISFIIDYLRISNKSYPFNWTITNCIKSICKAIDQNFIQFNNILSNQKLHSNHFTYKIQDLEIYLPHYHDDDENKAKMNTKINNFKQLIKSNKKVLFIYKSHLDNIPSINDIILLSNTIKNIERNITFDILIVNEYMSNENIIDYNIIDNVIIHNLIIEKPKDYKYQFLLNCNVRDNKSVVEIWKNQIIKIN